MSRLITAAERLEKARQLMQTARDLPIPEGMGWADFSYAAEIKDLMRQGRELIKFIPYTSGLTAETKDEAKLVAQEIDRTEKELLHRG
ncbi:MAG: hypothetical protein VB013_06435 [Anaerolineaceae bacterium]|nr:hypothetical protein [Anaerolineaceae bacterium]